MSKSQQPESESQSGVSEQPTDDAVTSDAVTEDVAAADSAAQESLPKDDPETEARIVEEASHRANWLAIAIGVIALASTVTLGWFGFLEWKRLNVTIAALESSQSTVRGLSTQIAQLTPRVEAVEPRFVDSERRVMAAQEAANAVLERVEVLAERLQASQVDTRETYLLAEAEYLLKLAQQRILIERSPSNALTLMQTADALVAELADPRLQSVREALALDMQALVGVPELDVLGVQAKVSAMTARLDDLTLPVRRLSAPVAELPDEVQPLMDRVSQYITIHRLDAPITPLVTAADAGRAREVLRLQLEQLKLAILREEAALFESTRLAALSTLSHYFDANTGAGAAIEAGLVALADVPVTRTIPEASEALVSLKSYRQQLLNRMAAARAVERTK
jgi:uroporphyrin-III C-methyltransferase